MNFDLTIIENNSNEIKYPKRRKVMGRFDVLIIGGGVGGSAIARELSRYQANVCVIEREEDVCDGTSKANSAIIHAGFDAAPGSFKAKLNVRGIELMGGL